MFSTDKNIETIGQLIEVLKHYIGLQKEFVKLDVVDKVVRLLTATAITAIIAITLLLALIYVSFAVCFALAPAVGMVGAFSIVGGAYLIILLLFVIFRHQCIEKPLVKFLASVLLGN